MELGHRARGQPVVGISFRFPLISMAKCVTHVVDEDVNPAEFLDGRSDGSIDGVVVTNIGHFVDDSTASIRSL